MACSVRDMAAKRNRAAVRNTVRTLKTLLKEKDVHDSKIDFGSLSSLTRQLLDSVKSRVDDARSLIERTKERREEGSLDDQTMRVEMLPAEVVVLLQETLEKMHEASSKSEHVASMRCIRTSADIFRAHLGEFSLLEEGRYPKNNLQLQEWLMSEKISTAREVYRDVVGALESTHKELGVEIPEFPRH